MTQFEYVSVLLSIILALGISEVIICWAKIIQRRSHVRFSIIHIFWTLFVVFMMVQFWWGFWDTRDVEVWSLFDLIGIVFASASLVICALLLTPPRSMVGEIDLENYYFDNTRPFFFLAALMLISQIIVATRLLGSDLLHFENIVRLIGVIVTLSVGFISNRKIHFAFPVIGVALMVVFLVLTGAG